MYRDSYVRDFHLIVPSNHIACGCRQGVLYLGQEQNPGRFNAHAEDAAYWQSKYALSKPSQRRTFPRCRPSRAATQPTPRRSGARIAVSIQAQPSAEGRLQALREAIVEVLEIRFGKVPCSLREELLAVVGEPELERLHRQAVLLPDLPTFQRTLAGAKAG